MQQLMMQISSDAQLKTSWELIRKISRTLNEHLTILINQYELYFLFIVL